MELIESLHSIFKPLSSRFERFFEVLPHTTLADDINKNAFLIDGHEYSDHWYEHNRAMLNALKADSQTNLLATLIKYCSDDHQFPPDVIKCQRLFLSLQAVQPTNILELGCGTSSMVISKYCSLQSTPCQALTIDNDLSWLNITKKKVDHLLSDMPNCDRHSFYHSESEPKTIAKVDNFVSCSERLFIFLDAKVIASDQTQGMDLINHVASKLPKTTIIMIDSRREAVFALQELSKITGRDIALITDVHTLAIPSVSSGIDSRNRDRLRTCAFSITQFESMAMQSIAVLSA